MGNVLSDGGQTPGKGVETPQKMSRVLAAQWADLGVQLARGCLLQSAISTG